MYNSIDSKIIDMLMGNARTPISSMAKKLSVSKGTVRNRLINLSRSRTIVGFKARVRFKQLGMEEVLVGFDIAPEHYMKAIGMLKKCDFIREVYRTSGDHSAMALVIESESKVEGKLKDLERIEGVRHVYPSFIQETVK